MAELEIQRDTVIINRLVYQTDTIFRTRILHQRVIEYLPATTGKSEIAESEPWENIQNIPPQVHKIDALSSLGNTDLHPEKNAQLHQSILQETTCLPLVEIDFSRPLPKIEKWPVSINKRHKTLRHYLYNLRPTGFSVGAAGGLAYPFKPDALSQFGWSAGIAGAMDFAKGWRLWSGVSQVRTNLLAKSMDLGIGAPPVDPPADGFIFKEADVQQGSWQFSLGFDRRFPGRRRLEPFVGLGWAVVNTLASEVSYDFIRQSDGVEWTIDRMFSSGPLRSDFGIVRTGLTFDFSRKWQMEFMASQRFHFEKSAERMPSVSVLQLGLWRTF
jgi:hypothetical protein